MWIVKEKLVYNVDTGLMEVLRFLIMNNIDAYNNEIGNVDLSDQLRGTYRCDIVVRNKKWWWGIWFWALGLMLVNLYYMYCVFLLSQGIERGKGHCRIMISESLLLRRGSILCTTTGVVRRLLLQLLITILLSIVQSSKEGQRESMVVHQQYHQ